MNSNSARKPSWWAWLFGVRPMYPVPQHRRPFFDKNEPTPPQVMSPRVSAWLTRELGAPEERQTGEITPVVRETGEQLALPAPPDERALAWSDLDTVRKLPLRELLTMPLPAQRQFPANNAPDNLPSQRFADLPTWIVRSDDKRPPWITDLLNGEPADFTEHDWINAPTPPVLAPLPVDAIAASDRVTIAPADSDVWPAGAYVEVWGEADQPTNALNELTMLASQAPNEKTAEVPTVMSDMVRRRYKQRESEE